jgi:hypothetical protein
MEELRQVVRTEVLKNEELIKSGKKERGEIPTRPHILPKMQQNIQDISVDLFNEVAQDPSKHAFVSLYAPGCTDPCYVFAQVAESFKNEDSVRNFLFLALPSWTPNGYSRPPVGLGSLHPWT